MGRKYFTSEDQSKLRKNPYVKNVSEKSITYTDEFREEFYSEYLKGIGPTQILREMGFDPSILGSDRILSITKRIKKYSQRVGGFKDKRRESSGRPRSKDLSIEEQLERLQHQNALLKQENEFLKKVEQIERRAERNMRLRAKNTN